MVAGLRRTPAGACAAPVRGTRRGVRSSRPRTERSHASASGTGGPGPEVAGRTGVRRPARSAGRRRAGRGGRGRAAAARPPPTGPSPGVSATTWKRPWTSRAETRRRSPSTSIHVRSSARPRGRTVVEVIGRMAPDLSGWTLSWTSRKRQSPLPPPNMISSQLGTEARPRFLAGFGFGSAGASAADSRSGSGARLVPVARCGPGRRRSVVEVGLDRLLGTEPGVGELHRGLLRGRGGLLAGRPSRSRRRPAGRPRRTAVSRRCRAAARSSEAGVASAASAAASGVASPTSQRASSSSTVTKLPRGSWEKVAVPVRPATSYSAGERPAAVLAAPGVPLDAARVDVVRPQVGGDGLAEGAGAGLGRAASYGRELGAVGDVGALGHHGRGERHDLLHRRPGGVRHRLGCLTGADARLDVAGAEA